MLQTHSTAPTRTVYLEGVLAPLERKNGWHLVKAAGDASPDGVRDFHFATQPLRQATHHQLVGGMVGRLARARARLK